MPEGPEVRRFADSVSSALVGKPIVSLAARTRRAKSWLAEHPDLLTGRRIELVRSRGKYLIGWIEGGYYFYSHLMMWGRWITSVEEPIEIDRRERARIVVPDATAILYSAPIFELGMGNPLEQVEPLITLGPEILPYPEQGAFDWQSVRARLLTPENQERPIGAALLDQQILAGIGNYLRAEILFDCRLDPWQKVAALTADDLERLCNSIVLMAQRAYQTGGFTVSPEDKIRLDSDSSLVYQLGSEFGTRHYVFRRTNLPCLRCGNIIRQIRQVTRSDDEEEKTRIIYFCPTCQNTKVELKKSKRKKYAVNVAQDTSQNTAEVGANALSNQVTATYE